MARHIDIRVRLDARTFRRYCAFDAFRRQRRWYWPALISMLLITASLAGLFNWVPQLSGASALLMGLGIAVPMMNLGLYFIPIEAQIAQQRLKQAPPVYALRLDDAEVSVTNLQKDEPPVSIPWEKMWAAFENQEDVYLYVNPDKALILPSGQASASTEALWSFIEKHLGSGKCLRVQRRSKR